MFQAITTKYLCPTNHRGARVKATAQAGSVTVSWDYALNADGNHTAAAQALAEKMGWNRTSPLANRPRVSVWHSGTDHKGNRVHVLERRTVEE
jgi:hypothetical protein